MTTQIILNIIFITTEENTFWEMLITQGLSISDITYFSKLFESKCSLHIAYTICILLVPQLVQLKHFHNIHVSISCSRNNAMCSVKSLLSWTHRKNTFSSPFSSYFGIPLLCLSTGMWVTWMESLAGLFPNLPPPPPLAPSILCSHGKTHRTPKE